MGLGMSGLIIDKIKGILDEFEDADLGIESNRELIALVIYRELLEDLDKKDNSITLYELDTNPNKQKKLLD